MLLNEIAQTTCRFVCINDKIMPLEEAQVSPFDRGYLFGDGVYEGVSFINGAMVDNHDHFLRLRNSLEQLAINCPWSDEEITKLQSQLIQQNDCQEGFCYYQITRGVASRDFSFPQVAEPRLFMFLKPTRLIDNPMAGSGVKVGFVDDIRWKKRNIKSIALLPQVLAKQQAVDKGCFEAWMIESDGLINEGSSSSAFIIKDDRIITAPLNGRILPGVTRKAIISLAGDMNIEVKERHFSPDEALHADEAFITSASLFVMPVTTIENTTIASGSPGEITLKLREAYIQKFCNQPPKNRTFSGREIKV